MRPRGALPNVLWNKAETKWVFLNTSESQNEVLWDYFKAFRTEVTFFEAVLWALVSSSALLKVMSPCAALGTKLWVCVLQAAY